MTTEQTAAARRVTYQLETLWDYDYVPTHDELATLYETAKKNQWNASTAINWTRPIGTEGPVLNVQMAFLGTDFFPRLTPEEQKETDSVAPLPDDEVVQQLPLPGQPDAASAAARARLGPDRAALPGAGPAGLISP